MRTHGTGIPEVSRNLAKAPAFQRLPLSPRLSPALCVPTIIDTPANHLLLYLQHSVYVWGVINAAGETKSSRFLLVVSEEIYGKQFV